MERYAELVDLLARSSRRREAKYRLRTAGRTAVPALRAGLRHPDPMVRRLCVSMLDRVVDDETLPDLVAALDDVDPDVCRRALHALACDQCKENGCLPGEELFVPRALELLARHANPDVRAGAADALGRVADRRPDVAAALAHSAGSDPNAGVRNIARRRAVRRQRPQVAEPSAEDGNIGAPF